MSRTLNENLSVAIDLLEARGGSESLDLGDLEKKIERGLRRVGIRDFDLDLDEDHGPGKLDLEVTDKGQRMYADEIDDDDDDYWEDEIEERAEDLHGKVEKVLKRLGFDPDQAETYPEIDYYHYNEEGEREDGDSAARGREYAEPHVWFKGVSKKSGRR